MFDHNACRVTCIGYALLSVTLLTAALRADTITPGAPTSNGTVTITLPDGSTINVPIPLTGPPPANTPTTATMKAILIYDAVPGARYVAPNATTGAPAMVIVPNGDAVTGDTTGEPNLVADLGLSLPGSPAYATLGFTGPLTATTNDGSESIFTASFGVDDSIFASASISYDQLTTPTVDGLMTGLYYELLADLCPWLQPDLSLDLPDDSITFDFPIGSGDYFVATSTTSPGTSQSLNVGGVTPAPEPVTSFSIGTGLLLIGILGRRSARKTVR